MLPPPVAVRSGSSQQLIWVFGFSFLPIAFGAGGTKASVRREAAARQFAGGADERGRKVDTAVTTRTRAALPGFTLYLYRRRGQKKCHGAGAQSGSISCESEDPGARMSRKVSRVRRSPSAHPAREVWTLRRRGGGEREGELGADFAFNSLPRSVKSAPGSPCSGPRVTPL
jgi:hypothetical protein